MSLLQVNAVSKSFGAIHALTDVSFSLEAGEVVGFMGDNGAGKSTMVKLIAGNFPPTQGEVVVDGQVCHFHKPIEARAKGIEVVYQDLALADNLSEIKTICHTGKKATMVVRVDDQGRAVKAGPQVEIGGNERYVSVSRAEFKKIMAGEGHIDLQQPQLPFEPLD